MTTRIILFFNLGDDGEAKVTVMATSRVSFQSTTAYVQLRILNGKTGAEVETRKQEAQKQEERKKS